MAKRSEKQVELEEKRDTYLKKMRRLGEALRELDKYRRKQEQKIAKKRSSYEDKLKKIDDQLQGI